MRTLCRRFRPGGSRLVPSVARLEAGRRLVTEARLAAAQVVPTLDEPEHGPADLALRPERVSLDGIALQRGEEQLAHGVIVPVAYRAHRGTHPWFSAATSERVERVLVQYTKQ